MADCLSPLPDEILHQILSDLPIVSQIETSLLSRRWRNLWSLNPALRLLDWPNHKHNLSYDEKPYSYPPPKFDRGKRRLFRRVIHHWQAPYLLDFQANLSDMDLRSVTKRRWIDFASSSSLQHLTLEYHNSDDPPFSQYMQNGLSSLEILLLKRVRLTNGAPLSQYMKKGLPSLTSLHLMDVSLTDIDLGCIFSSCPVLERLKLERCSGLDHVVVSSPILKALEVDCRFTNMKALVITEAPSLVDFSCDPNSYTLISIESHLPQLIGFSLHTSWVHTELDYLWLIQRVQILSIDLVLLKSLVYKVGRKKSLVFEHLKELHLNVEILEDRLLDALHLFLGSQPFIKKLCISIGHGQRYRDWSDYDDINTSADKYYRKVGLVYESNRTKPCFKPLKCSSSLARLRTARLIGFMGTRNEMRLVRFLLESASNLEALRLFCSWSWPKNLIQQLSWCHRATSKARILVAGDVDHINKLCQHPETFPLYDDCGQEAEEDKYISICPSHSIDPIRQRMRMKYVYVHKSKGNHTREKRRGRRCWQN